jgi:hypothetical protein
VTSTNVGGKNESLNVELSICMQKSRPAHPRAPGTLADGSYVAATTNFGPDDLGEFVAEVAPRVASTEKRAARDARPT